MLKSLLLALDGSPYSAVAQELAVQLARRHRTALCGIGVLDVTSIRKPEMVPIGGDAFKRMREETYRLQAEERVDRFLGDLEDRCQSLELACQIKKLEGVPHEEIAREARLHDLIVISRETHFHFPGDGRVGDTLRRLAQETPRPILAAPTEHREGRGVVVAYDDSAPAARALQMFALTGLEADQEVVVICVDPHRKTAQERCARAVEFVSRHGRPTRGFPIASHGRPAELILQEIDSLQPSLMVMGCHGHTGLKEKLLGSTTQEFLFSYNFPVPIFLYH